MSFQKELFNQYNVVFKNNPPLIVWAKNYETTVVDGIDKIKFINTYIDTRIEYINSIEILYIETKRYSVLLDV